jgi:transcriptional repressor AefR-like protein
MLAVAIVVGLVVVALVADRRRPACETSLMHSTYRCRFQELGRPVLQQWRHGTRNEQGMTFAMNSQTATSPEHSRATIMAKLATVLRDCDASITNIESAIAKAGVSVQEISARFGGPRELILALASELSDSMSALLTTDSTKPGLRQRLLEFGQCVTDIYVTSHWGALYRIAVTESIRHTDLGRDFHEVGPGRLTRRLADFLRIAQAEGALGSADPHLLASHFLSPLRAILDVAATFSHDLATSPVACSAHVRNVVDLFCRGINRGKQLC